MLSNTPEWNNKVYQHALNYLIYTLLILYFDTRLPTCITISKNLSQPLFQVWKHKCYFVVFGKQRKYWFDYPHTKRKHHSTKGNHYWMVTVREYEKRSSEFSLFPFLSVMQLAFNRIICSELRKCLDSKNSYRIKEIYRECVIWMLGCFDIHSATQC